MLRSIQKICLSFTVLTVCLYVSPGRAQEVEASDELEQQSADTSNRLLYIDLPVALEEGVGPAMPEPIYREQPNAEDDPEHGLREQYIREYNSAVEEIEYTGGAWDRALVEELFALGLLQQQQGDHDAAVKTFGRAIHVNRINDGLYTLQQIPHVESMLDSYLALKDWQNADDYNNYLFFIQRKAFGANDPRIIPVLDRLANWNLQAFDLGYGDFPGLRLSTAQILFRAAARMVGAHFGRSDERYVPLKTNIAKSAYMVSRYRNYATELQRPEFRITEDSLLRSLNQGGRGPVGFRSGENALLDIVDYYNEESSSRLDLAAAISNLGDWYVLFNQRRQAQESYNLAWQILAELDNCDELIQQFFGQVVPIPIFGRPTSLGTAVPNDFTREGLRSAYADVIFDVSAMGGVRNLRMQSEITEENSDQLSRLRREIRRSTFRPLIIEGQPVISRDHQFRYRYWY